jgi:hypothetical protein
MTNRYSAYCLAALVLFACPVAAVELVGPFQVKNQFPIFLYTDQPYLEPAALADSFSVSLSHSSLFVMEDSSAWSAHLDLELTELNFRYRRTVPGGIELGVDLPLVRATAGFLDRPLAWYHRAFGFPDYNRNTRPDNAFLYEVRRNGMPVVMGENDKAGIGDVRVSAKKQLLADDLLVSVMGTVELPTGDAQAGYGNGSVDAGVALLMDKRLGQDTLWYANLGVLFPGDLKAYQTVRLRNYGFAGTGMEALVRPSLSLIGQVSVQTSPYPRTEISQIDRSAMLLLVGGRYYAESGSFELSLTEDLNTSGAPDFILDLSWKRKW